MLKRSNSSSHIPLPKNESRSRSKSVLRTSSKDASCSSAKKSRAGSFDRLMPPTLKRSTSFLSSGKRSTVTTPTIGIPGVKRSTSNTPSSSRSKSKSPFKFGSAKAERYVNDKKWVSAQYQKVHIYLQDHPTCPENIPDIIKPPTINTFVYVINLLLKEIDPRVEINTTNYKDIVLNTLKKLHYPGNISNSLLKTVNTMHAWPQVISILSWLVDLILVIKRVDMTVPEDLAEDPRYKKIECVTDYIIQRYLQYNNNADQTSADKMFGENFAKILNIDEGEILKLNEEVSNLYMLKEKQTMEINEQKNKNDMIKKQTDKLQEEIDTFYNENKAKQEDNDEEIAMLKTKKTKIGELLRLKRAAVEKLHEALDKQPYTLDEKTKMLKHIDELKHTIALKKEKIDAKQHVKTQCDLKLAEAKKKVETQVYRLNNSVMELCVWEPELKILKLKDTNFTSSDFTNDVQTFCRNLKMFENKFNEEIRLTTSLLSKVKTDNSALEQKIETFKTAIQKLQETEKSLNKQLEKCAEEKENMLKKHEERKEIFAQRVNKISKSEPNVDEVRRTLEDLRNQKMKKEEDFDSLKEQSCEFFVKLRDIIMSNLSNMNAIRTDIFNMLVESLKKVDSVQNEIAEDLHKLDELKE